MYFSKKITNTNVNTPFVSQCATTFFSVRYASVELSKRCVKITGRNMLRPLFKLMAFISFTLMIIALVIDGTRSVSTSHWETTPLNKMLENLLQTDIYGLNQSMHNMTLPLLHSICITLICLPIWSILGTLAIIFCILSYEKQKPFHKIFYR